MNVNIYYIKDYQIFIPLAGQKNKPNSNPISERPKMSANVFLTKDYENKTASGSKKTNPNKPNSNPALSFGCSSFKNFHSFCLKVPVETGHVKTLEEAK